MLLKVSLNFRLGSGLVPDDIPAPIWGLDSLNLYSARKKEKRKKEFNNYNQLCTHFEANALIQEKC